MEAHQEIVCGHIFVLYRNEGSLCTSCDRGQHLNCIISTSH